MHKLMKCQCASDELPGGMRHAESVVRGLLEEQSSPRDDFSMKNVRHTEN